LQANEHLPRRHNPSAGDAPSRRTFWIIVHGMIETEKALTSRRIHPSTAR